MRKINDTMNRLAVAAYVKGGRMRKKLADVLIRKEGEGFVDTALTQRIQNLFNYQG